MDPTALRAARMMMGQAAVLRKMSSDPGELEEFDEGGMLFKRSVQMPAQGTIPQLLQKWNPGVPEQTLRDLEASVYRWNQLPAGFRVDAGRFILIPTVYPAGRSPKTQARQKALSQRRPGLWTNPPQRSPKLALGSSLTELRARTAKPAASIWATNQNGQSLAGAEVKDRFQSSLWK